MYAVPSHSDEFRIKSFSLTWLVSGHGSVDRWGVTPIFDAIKHGNSAVARTLYENGARLSKGKAATFLCSAAGEGDWTTLQTLHE
jgi:IS5 family transposase